MGRKIFIKSIPRETSLKIEDWVNDSSGIKMKKTKIGLTRDTLVALYDPRVGGLKNGLSNKPWMEEGKQVKDDQGNSLTLQDKMEKKWNLPKGFLTNKTWRKGDSLKEEDLTYYQRKSWKLNDGSTVLDMDNMEDELFYYLSLDSKLIANSEAEWRAHKWPKATHYIAWENEADEIKFSRTSQKSKAYSLLHDNSMTPTMKRKFIFLLGLASSNVSLTDEQVHNLLYDYIESTNFAPGSNIEKFQELANLLSTAPGRDEIEARFLLKQAIDYRIMYEKAGTYTWVRPDGTIELGNTLSEAIDFILNPKKKGLVEELTNAIKAKQ
jgi:hypothetical protein